VKEAEVKRWPSTTLATAAVALAAAAGLAQAQSDEKQLADTVRVQLQARDPESALRTLERLQAQRGAQAPDYDLLFLQGVTWQELDARGHGLNREKAAEQARKAYLQALELRPNVPASSQKSRTRAASPGASSSAASMSRTIRS